MASGGNALVSTSGAACAMGAAGLDASAGDGTAVEPGEGSSACIDLASGPVGLTREGGPTPAIARPPALGANPPGAITVAVTAEA